MRGDLDRAIELYRSSLATFQDLGDRRGVADALFGIAVMSRLRGDLETARSSARATLEAEDEPESHGVRRTNADRPRAGGHGEAVTYGLVAQVASL
jgi:hypothetical protein